MGYKQHNKMHSVVSCARCHWKFEIISIFNFHISQYTCSAVMHLKWGGNSLQRDYKMCLEMCQWKNFSQKLRCHRGTTWCAMSVEILSTSVQLYETQQMKRSATGELPQSSLKVTGNGTIYHFLLVARTSLSCTVSVWDITTHTVYMTDCDLLKFFSFDTTIESTGHV